MTIDEAKDALLAQYQSAHKVPLPVLDITVGTYNSNPVIAIFVNRKALGYKPPESLSGVGYQGFECVAYNYASQVISDSGVIS